MFKQKKAKTQLFPMEFGYNMDRVIVYVSIRKIHKISAIVKNVADILHICLYQDSIVTLSSEMGLICRAY